METGFLVLLAIGYCVLPFLGLAAYLQVRRLTARVVQLESALARFQAPPIPPVADLQPAPVSEPTTAAPPPEPLPEEPPQKQPTPAPAPAEPDMAVLETRLTGRWLVWIGGVALTLGGAFLVQASIEAGLLSPPIRILLGLAFAVLLVIAGDWLRRRPPPRGVGPLAADHLAPSVTGAGIAVAYAAVFAAHGLYGLIAQVAAFGALAAVSLVSVGLGLLHGPPVAALGFAGALAVPLVVGGESEDGVALFAYLTAIAAVAGLVARWRGWSWALLMVHGGGMAWVFLWTDASLAEGPPWSASLFLLASLALAVALRRRDSAGLSLGFGRFRQALDGTGAALAGFTILGVLCVLGDGTPLLVGIVAAGTAALLLADDRAGPLPTGGGVLGVLALLFGALALEGGTDGGWIYALASAAALALAAFVAAHGSPYAGYFTLVGGAGSLLLVALGYTLDTGGDPDSGWALVALAVAGLHTALAGYAARHRDDPHWGPVLAGHATAALAGVALGAALILREAWLTVAVASTVTAAAYVHRHLPFPSLRAVALALAATVIVRLTANPWMLDYALGGPLPGGAGWVWTGYGLSAAAFFLARLLFAGAAGPTLRNTLDGGVLSFTVLLVSVQIRLAVADGPLDRAGYDLLEQSLNSAWWLGVALFLFSRDRPDAGPVVRWGWRVLGTLGAAQVVIGHGLASNPLFTDDPVGATPLFNLLFLAYAVPAVLAAGFARLAQRRGMPRLALWAGVGALSSAWMWLTLSVRHAFHGTRLGEPDFGDAELYAYSVAWLAFGGALLAAGLRRHSLALRYASLAIILVSVGKVFLVDMAALTGLWRAVSFIGLGAALLGVGFVYQRFVLARPAA